MSFNTITEKNKPTKAFIYCRVSSTSQNNYLHSTSMETQEEYCRKFCEENNIQVLDVYREVHSARNMDKMSEFNSMWRKLYHWNRKYKYSDASSVMLVVYDITRFSRNTRQALDYLEKLCENGQTIYSVSERVTYNHYSERNIFRITLSKSENESDTIQDRVKKSIEFRRKRGDVFGRAPYGTEAVKDPDTKVRSLIVNTFEHDIIKRIVDMAKTRSSTDIVKTLVSQGFKKRGRNWTAGAVRHLLKRQGQGKCKGTTFGIKKTSFKNRR